MNIKIKQITSKLDKEINIFEPGAKLVGIDVGTRFIKVVVLKEAPIGTRLLSIGIAEVQKQEGDEAAGTLQKNINAALKNAYTQLKTSASNNVCAIIKTPSLNIKNLSLPLMPDNELKESVKWEMEQNISYPIEEATIDFLVCGEIIRAGAKNVELEVISAKTEEIKESMHFYARNRLNIKEITMEPFCLWNVFQKSNLWKEEDTIALIDIGAKTTKISIFNNNVLRFTREIFFGGDTITELIAKESGIGFEEAEQAKIKYGLSDNAAYYATIAASLKQMTSEIGRSIGYYKGQFHIDRIDRMVFYGGGSRLINLEKFVSEELGIFAEAANPFNGLLFDQTSFVNFEEFMAFFAAAIGAALTSGDAKRPNLLPAEFKKDTKRQFKILLIKIIPVLLIAALFLLYTRVINLEKKLTKEKREKQELITLWESEQQLVKKLDFLKSIQDAKESWLKILKGITESIPEGVWLNNFSLNENDKTLILNGAAKTNILAIEFVRKLETLPHFKNVTLGTAEEKIDAGEANIYFKITISKR
ncbi:MAG: type IV pilus assembly protein PilM [Candidatus Omnitrophica bacterium]|nr:type IV pilus assembly protein PilM [Candidatus Omnitrophota bacterium]